ncbi:MAG: 23S rRNA (uracil(1939)-C(5))-methyltransferase RlmD [Candidatus Pelagadaptatus aseana]|uniref:23S rRNA (uracil(1939)-C(5))-methyltransferase RlmD n=1 Tax=Candidatus Pelagadaptatus aseana TaxID=3120508 RepID=UPI0039B23899
MARIFKPSRSGQGKSAQKSGEKAPRQLTIESLSPEGRGIARHQGKTVFVSGALPGETVEISHYQRHKRYSECQVKQVLTPSAHRVTAPCPHYQSCGGCQLQHLAVSQQLHEKQQSLLEALKHQLPGKADFDVLPPITSTESYRSRARVGVSREGRMGFRSRQSDQLIAVYHCQVLAPQLQLVWAPLQLWLNGFSGASGVTHIELIASAFAGLEAEGSVIVIRHTRPIPEFQRQLLWQRLSELEAPVCCWLQGAKNGALTPLVVDQPVLQSQYLLMNQSVTVRFEPSDFTQVNRQVNEQMVIQAVDWLQLQQDDVVLDLFCGIGNFTLPMAQQAGKVVGIEGVETMVERGRANAELNRLDNVYFKALNLDQPDLGSALKREGANKFLLDPPRAGAKFICQQWGQTDFESGVYVSCNPASLVRDAAILSQQGFELSAIRVLDMFPHTAHVETMALFTRV